MLAHVGPSAAECINSYFQELCVAQRFTVIFVSVVAALLDNRRQLSRWSEDVAKGAEWLTRRFLRRSGEPVPSLPSRRPTTPAAAAGDVDRTTSTVDHFITVSA